MAIGVGFTYKFRNGAPVDAYQTIQEETLVEWALENPTLNLRQLVKKIICESWWDFEITRIRFIEKEE